MSKSRASNIELLRIIAIFLIMLVHANYRTFGDVSVEDINNSSILSLSRINLEVISIVCVDVFVLISGWFGAHPKVKSILGLIFQCIFIKAIVFMVYALIGIVDISPKLVIDVFFKYPHFVHCYIVLMILCPILNAFIESSSRKVFLSVLTSYYIYAFVFGWFFHCDMGFNAGNTTLSFVGLYLLARYIKLYHEKDIKLLSGAKWLLIWGISVLIFTLFLWGLPNIGINSHKYMVICGMFYSYLSPFVIIMSLLLLFGFSNIELRSSLINWIAISSFASVLLHGPMMDEVYCELLITLNNNNSTLSFVVYALLMMLSYLFVGVFIDKVRIFLWNKLLYKINGLKKLS